MRKSAKVPKSTRKATPPRCSVDGCFRPVYARALCESHHRQFVTTGKCGPIRPYRTRREGTVKYSGLTLTSDCALKVDRLARDKGLSRSAAIATILEQWTDSQVARSRATDLGG